MFHVQQINGGGAEPIHVLAHDGPAVHSGRTGQSERSTHCRDRAVVEQQIQKAMLREHLAELNPGSVRLPADEIHLFRNNALCAGEQAFCSCAHLFATRLVRNDLEKFEE